MQLIIKDDIIVATHSDEQDIAALYPDCECVSWHGSLPLYEPGDPPLHDPRTKEEKKQSYKDKRRNAYPPVAAQLDMLYHDKEDGTNTWVETIRGVKQRFPKPVEGLL